MQEGVSGLFKEENSVAQYFDNIVLENRKTYDYIAEINGVRYPLQGTDGTFSKDCLDDGTKLLLETILQADLGSKILDLGCGTGPIGLILAASDPKRIVTMSDVNLTALELAKKNAERLGVEKRVEIVNSDVYHNINSTFDTIVSNPPIRAGKKVTYAIYDGAVDHLKEGGSLIIVIRRKQGADSVQAYLESRFGNVRMIASHKGYRVFQAMKKGANNG